MAYAGTVPQAEMMPAGALIQQVYSSTGAVLTTTTIMPNDDTIPQNTEGAQFLTATITPKMASSKLLITVNMMLSPSASSNMIMALFRDSTASAVAAAMALGSGASELRNCTLQWVENSNATTATTFNVRAGMGNAGTLTVNGAGGTRLLGGASISSICIQEIAA